MVLSMLMDRIVLDPLKMRSLGVEGSGSRVVDPFSANYPNSIREKSKQ